jgi:glutamyl-tRNA synthetase
VETFISRYGSKLTVNDLVLGEVDFDLAHLNHFVMARSNGDYLYIFTNLVDDISMKITHVIRGMDLLNSTPAQILLKKLLDSIGTESQKIHYGHIPLIKRKGGGKLSKRDSESDFFSYIKSGYLPEAIINYLILIGWGSSDDRELFQLDEFIKFFDLKKLGRSSAFLDLDKLRSINSLYINQLDDGAFLFRYREYVRSYSDSENREKILNDDLQKKLSKLVPVVKSRVKNFAEVEMYIKPLLIASSELLQHRRELEIEAHDSRERVQDALSALAQIPNGEKCREIMIALDKQERRAIRYILAASNVTIPLNDLIAVLGGEIIEERRRVFTSLF